MVFGAGISARIGANLAPQGTRFQATSITGCIVWVYGDTGITLNGSNVSAWNDQSGNAHHFTQGTAAKQPLFVSNGLNGHGTVRFAGGMTANSNSLGTASFTLAQPMDIYMVFKTIAHVTNAVILTDTSANAFPEILNGTGNSTISFYAGSSFINVSFTDNTFGVLRFQVNGASGAATVGRSATTTGNVGTNGTSTGFQIAQYQGGGVSVSNGNIEVAELIIYNSILSAANANTVMSNLLNIYPSATA
jgi:hypothetical protein